MRASSSLFLLLSSSLLVLVSIDLVSTIDGHLYFESLVHRITGPSFPVYSRLASRHVAYANESPSGEREKERERKREGEPARA